MILPKSRWWQIAPYIRDVFERESIVAAFRKPKASGAVVLATPKRAVAEESALWDELIDRLGERMREVEGIAKELRRLAKVRYEDR